jgi:PKD repeat protein
MTTYYVATTGSNSTGDGSSGSPWETITYAIAQAVNGDIIEVAAGTYNETVRVNKNIWVNGTNAVLDGNWNGLYGASGNFTSALPGGDPYTNVNVIYNAMVRVSADNAVVSGFEIENSTGRGFAIEANNVQLDDLIIHDCYSAGGVFYQVNGGLLTDSSCTAVGLQRLDPQNPANDWPVSINTVRSSNVTIRNITVHDTQGEGVNLGGWDNTLEDSEVYNNRALNVYLQQAVRGTVRRCLVYNTSDATYGPSPGIVMATEHQFETGGVAEGATIENNLIMHCRDIFAFWSQSRGALIDCTIAHNTFVNATTNTSTSKTGYVLHVDTPVAGYAHSNTVIHSNVFVQTITTNGEEMLLWPGGTDGVAFYNNHWSETVDARFQGAGDVYDITLSDFANAGTAVPTTSAPDPADYEPIAASPVVDNGWSGSNVPSDYYQNGRDGSPDAGAFEYGGGSAPPTGTGVVTLETAVSSYATSSGETTITHSVNLDTDTNKVIFFVRRAWFYTESPTITSAEYNGTSLTLLGASAIGSSGSYRYQIHAYELDNPDTGNAYDLEIISSQTCVAGHVTVIPLSSADTTHNVTPFTGTSTTPSGTIEATYDDSMIFGGFLHRGHDADPFTPGSGVTEYTDDDTGGSSDVSDFGAWDGYINGSVASSNYTIECTAQDSDLWLGLVLEIKAMPAASSSGEVVVETAVSPYTATTGETTITHSINLDTDTEKIIVFVRRVWWYTESPTITAATFNGSDLTLLASSNVESNGSYRYQIHAYELDNPDTGSAYNLVITSAQAVVGSYVDIIPLSGTDTATGATVFTGTSNTPNGTIQASGDNSIVIGGFLHRGHDADPFTHGLNVTEYTDGDSGGSSDVSDFGAWAGYKNGTVSGTNYTIDCTAQDSDLWIGIVLEVTAAATSTTYPITADFTAYPTNGTADITSLFSDASTTTDPNGLDTWKWEYRSGASWTQFSTSQNPSQQFNAAGVYDIRLTVTNDAGDSATEEKIGFITVDAAGTETYVNAQFTATPTSGNASLSVSFTDISTTNDTAVTGWVWEYRTTDGDWTQFSTSQNPTYAFAAAGVYDIRLTASTTNGFSSSLIQTGFITVTTGPTVSAGFTYTPPSGVYSVVVQFTDVSTATDDTITGWSWEYDSGGGWTAFSSSQNPSHTFTAGIYNIRLTITTASSSTDTYTVNGAIVVAATTPTAPTLTGSALSLADRLALQIYDNADRDNLLADFSGKLTSFTFGTNPHGFAVCEAFVPMTLDDAFTAFDWPETPHVVVSDLGGADVWQGRLEDIEIADTGVSFVSLGYWRAFTDVRYTAFWSSTDYDDWRELTADDYPSMTDKKFAIDRNNRLFLSLKKNTIYDNGNGMSFAFWVPDGSVTNIAEVSFDYELNVPSRFIARFISALSLDSGGTWEWTLRGDGTVQSGSETIVFDIGRPLVRFSLSTVPALSSVLYEGEDGDAYFKITNLRVKAKSGTVLASDVAASIVETVNGKNSGQLSSSTALLETSTSDFNDLSYQDDRIDKLLDEIVVPDGFEAAVWEAQMLTFREKDGNQTRAWFVDVINFVGLQRSLDGVQNEVRALYNGSHNRKVFTDAATDSESVTRYGLIRQGTIKARTSSTAEAERYRDRELADTANAALRAGVVFDRLYDASGAEYPLYMLRAGDTITLRNLPPTLLTRIDNVRTFRIGATTFDAISNQIEAEPEDPLPNLAVFVGRRDFGF